MQTVDRIINSKWIITCESKNRILEDHSMVLQDGKILEILPTEAAKQKYKADSVENYATHAITPGFINSHTHMGMSYLRGYADDLALMDWLNDHMWPAEKRWVSAEFVKDATEFGIAELIRSGSTCFNDMYFFMHDAAAAAEKAGIRAHIGATHNLPNKLG